MKTLVKSLGSKLKSRVNSGLRFWKVRHRISIKNDSHPKAYDRYDVKYGLHKEVKKPEEIV